MFRIPVSSVGAAVCFVLVSSFVVPAHAAPITYQYTGNPFNYCGWGCGPESDDVGDPDSVPDNWSTNYLVGSLTFSGALAANMTMTNVYGSAALLAWSFGDAQGYFAVSSANGDVLHGVEGDDTNQISIATDANGNISQWQIGSVSEAEGSDHFALLNPMFYDDELDGFIADALTKDYLGPNEWNVLNDAPGEWTPVPEPATLTLTGLGVGALLNRYRRRRSTV